MDTNERPWEQRKIAEDALRHDFDKHRAEAMSCPEDCWCWSVEALLNALEYEHEGEG